MSRPTSHPQAGLALLIMLALLTLALMAAPCPSSGGVFGQPGPSTSVRAPQSVYAPSR
jgi:hypothetical protein